MPGLADDACAWLPAQSNVPRQDKLINYAKVAEQRRRQAKQQQLAKQQEQCTFKPNTSATRSYRSRTTAAPSTRNTKRRGGAGRNSRGRNVEEPVGDRLYKLHTLRQAKLKRERKKKEEAAKEAVRMARLYCRGGRGGVCAHSVCLSVCVSACVCLSACA